MPAAASASAAAAAAASAAAGVASLSSVLPPPPSSSSSAGAASSTASKRSCNHGPNAVCNACQSASTTGKHAAIAVAPSGQAVIAWYDSGKLAVGSLGLDGVSGESKVAKAAGDFLAPALAPGAQRGEWYVAWLDQEAGHAEPYAARVLCK